MYYRPMEKEKSEGKERKESKGGREKGGAVGRREGTEENKLEASSG